jgi:hypothetical protein
MGLDARIVVTRIAHAARKGGAMLARPFARLGEARRCHTAQEQDFYRMFAGYCRANNLSPVCADDWKLRGWRQN